MQPLVSQTFFALVQLRKILYVVEVFVPARRLLVDLEMGQIDYVDFDSIQFIDNSCGEAYTGSGLALPQCMIARPVPRSFQTDEFSAYLWLDSSEFVHRAVNHGETYVKKTKKGKIHTNGVENVWSLFKRGITGVFHKVSAKYLPLYLNEFSFPVQQSR